jgi:hypothetical protein
MHAPAGNVDRRLAQQHVSSIDMSACMREVGGSYSRGICSLAHATPACGAACLIEYSRMPARHSGSWLY